MRKSLYTERESNIRRTWAIFAVFLVVVIGVGWVFSLVYETTSILYLAVGLALVFNIGAYWYSDKLVLLMAGAKPIEEKDNKELYRIVENLAITAGLPTPKIYIINEATPNAFATGRDPRHAVVAVTRGLLERLDRTELEGVLAHELGHIGNRDMLLQTVVVVLAGFIAILSDIFLRQIFWGRFSNRDNDRAKTVIMVIAVVVAILTPIAATLMRLAISRKREYLADASGALLTRYPEGLASALEKISAEKQPMRAANNSTAHLWIDDPFMKKQKGAWLHGMFMTHPPTEERIKRLRGMEV